MSTGTTGRRFLAACLVSAPFLLMPQALAEDQTLATGATQVAQKVSVKAVSAVPTVFSTKRGPQQIEAPFQIVATDEAAGLAQGRAYWLKSTTRIATKAGQVVRTLVGESLVPVTAATQTGAVLPVTLALAWDGKNDAGQEVPDDTYVVLVGGQYVSRETTAGGTVENLIQATPAVAAFGAAGSAGASYIIKHTDLVGPFRWAKRLHDPASPSPLAVARSGDSENATAVGDAASAQGLLDLTQWSGDNQAGMRSFGGNTLVGAPATNYYVRLDTWEIQVGEDEGARFSFWPMRQQDAHLRMGFLAADATDIHARHGAGFSFADPLPFNALVVELSFRRVLGGGTAWQHDPHSGIPTEAGVWQVPAGQTLDQAQASGANRLSSLKVLREVPPAAAKEITFKFQVQRGGNWQLLVDINKDGFVDLHLTSEQPGNKASTLTDVSEASGLVVAAFSHGGAHAGKVARSTMRVNYVASPSEAVPGATSVPPGTTPIPGEPHDTRPLLANIPQASAVSPVTIEGERWAEKYKVTAAGPTFPDGKGAVACLGEKRFLVDLPLDPDKPAQIVLTQSGTPPTVVTGEVTWTPTDLTDKRDSQDEIVIRKGDSLLLTASPRPVGEGQGEGAVPPPPPPPPDGTSNGAAVPPASGLQPPACLELDGDGDGTYELRGAPGARFPVKYDTEGVFIAAARIDGVVVGTLKIKVIGVVFPKKVACEVAYTRIVDVNTGGYPAGDVWFGPGDPADLTVSVQQVSGNWVRLLVTPLRPGTPVILARLGNRNGSALATKEVDEFDVFLPAKGGVIFDSTGRGESCLIIDRDIPDLIARFEMFASSTTFDGGLDRVECSTSTFRVVANKATGGKARRLDFALQMLPSERSFCFHLTMFQESFQVSHRH